MYSNTSPYKVEPEANYSPDSFVGIAEFKNEYMLVGGINAPKQIKCRGTDGKWRTQLVKGRDDLRQDAVMQQVFGLMNTLLRNDPKTRKRRLQIRQYKVVPLSQTSGILEWCENTIVMKDYLIGENYLTGAHKRYHPNDLTAQECRKKFTAAQENGKRNEAYILKVFLDLCGKFMPAMKYFFFENFPSAGLYIERRLAYARSVATSSMIGYILGLGDRHVQNILLDNHTAEMIHIDLGIAFEQGKILPTPELIPFRLTRDVVDGFGPSGVEGTFRMCCEATIKVLRGHKDEVMTVLEVMMFDPLYNWSLTPAKVYRLQYGKEANPSLKLKWEKAKQKREMERKNDKGSNKMAERVLLRVSQKLNGSEEGSYLSIEGQVNALIQQAQDPKRLCKVFAGWQPYI